MAIKRHTTHSSSSLEVVTSDKGTTHKAAVLLDQLKSIMWVNVRVVRTLSKLTAAVSDLLAIRNKAGREVIQKFHAENL